MAVRAALKRDGYKVDASALTTALALSQGSVRRALELATGEGIQLYRDLLASLGGLPELDGPRLHRLVERLGGAGDSERLELFLSLLLGLLERLICATATGEELSSDERDLQRRLLGRANLPRWVEVWDAIGRAKADAANLNLDRSLLVLEAFYRLQQVARENPV
jgi:DNA polymerase-3 subunit delta'